MNGFVSDFQSKFDTNQMYVINQKVSHFQNNVPTGPIYFPTDNGMHPTGQMIGDQMAFSPCMPSMMPSINNYGQMQSSMSKFINPQNTNSIRQHSIMAPTMMAQVNKTHKPSMMVEETGMQYQPGDNFPTMTTSYKSRNTSLDSLQNGTINNTNLGSDAIIVQNIPPDPNIGLHIGNNSRSQTPRNKRSRINNSRATPPCAKDSCNTQTALTSSHNNNNNNNNISNNNNSNNNINNNNNNNNNNSNNNCNSNSNCTNNCNNNNCNNNSNNNNNNNNKSIKSTSSNMNNMPVAASPGIPPQHKCLPPAPLNGTLPMQYPMVDMVPQQIRQRMPLNVINTYGCNRLPMMDKSMSIFQNGTHLTNHPGAIFNTSHPVSPFYFQLDNGVPLPMFHLHSRLSKIPEFDRLTFTVNHGNLWGPQALRHGDQITEIQFELSHENLQQIVNRSDLDIVVTSFTHRDQFRLCHWPDFLELRINGHLLTLDTTVMQDLKVHMPCCIKHYCKLGINTLHFTVTKCICCHLFHAFMVHRPTLQHALETIQTKSISTAITKSLLSEIYLRNSTLVNGPEDSSNVCVVNLICPMSQVRISIPARTKFCKHIQPFDLQEFLRVQIRWPQYFCPICRVRITFNLNEYIQNVIVDDIIKDIISKVDLSVKRVIIYPDGKWKPTVDINQNCSATFVSPNLSESHNHESNFSTIHQSPVAIRSTALSPMPVHSKQNLCNDNFLDKRSKVLHSPLNFDCNTEGKSIKSPGINNVSSSTMASPAPLRNLYGNSMTSVDSLSRSATPLTSKNIDPSPPKRNKISPNHQINGEAFSNMSLMKFPNNNAKESLIINESSQKNAISYQADPFSLNQNINSGSPESIKTPLSTTTITPASQGSCIPNMSSQVSSAYHNSIKHVVSNNYQQTQIVSSSREQLSLIHHESDTGLISSTTGSGTNITSTRPPTSVNGDIINKQVSSGSSDPSSPPEFFDPHSATTNYDDDENSSLHLQRLIGFIDEILSEEEEYVLDTQWASFTWPSADKSLDLLHLTDIEKFL